jgi:eukaryotic-like serine/threonine-protein kinase
MTIVAEHAFSTRLGSYELVARLAQGGMADIYLGRHVDSEQLAAIKVLSAQRAKDAESRVLFADEARLAMLLDHANLASVHEVAMAAGVHYLAMDYVDGADLRELLTRAQAADLAIAHDCALSIVAGAAAGLDHAHRQCDARGRPLHLVHRDVSLSNIMVARDGAVKVIDFGIAISTASMHHTNPGVVRGKASYMSPEQCLGRAVDLRSDVYALGVVLYELTTGHRCFAGDSDFERMLAVVRGDFALPSTLVEDFPIALEHVILTALALDPAHRYPSAAAMIDALEQVAALEGWSLGPHAMARTMEQLFGHGASAPGAEVEPTIRHAELAPYIAAPAVTTSLTRPRRLARGTESDACESPQSCEWQDDVPTRGRRSLSRMTYNPVAA